MIFNEINYFIDLLFIIIQFLYHMKIILITFLLWFNIANDANDDPNLQQSLLNIQVQGNWFSVKDVFPFRYLDHLTGEAIITFYHNTQYDSKNNNQTNPHVNCVSVVLLDQKYFDKKYAILTIPLKRYQQGTWNGSTQSTYSLVNHDTQIQSGLLKTAFFINGTQIKLFSSQFIVQIKYKEKKLKTSFIFLMPIPVILQFILLYFITKQQIQDEKISIFPLACLIACFLYFGFKQIIIGITNLKNILIISIFTGILNFCCTVRMVYVFNNVIRRIHSVKGYIQFYVFSITYIFLLYLFNFTDLINLLSCFWLVGQIIHNIIKGLKPGFNIFYIGIITSGQLYLFYTKGYYDNLDNQTPNTALCLSMALIILAQILILYGQNQFGNKFFIPKRFILNHYNYIHVLEIDNKVLSVPQCSICLGSLKYQQPENHPSTEIQMEQYDENRQKKRVKIMVTPCGHKFHIKCLQSWMEVRLQCPFDRATLPAFQ